MDNDTKDFFEKLSGVNSRSDEEEETEEEAEEEKEESEDEDDEEVEVETETDEDEAEEDASEIDETEGQLTVDVYETPTSYVVKSALAGISPDKLDISITSEGVTIRGTREQEEKVKSASYLHQECYWGKFSRSIILPQEIDPNKSTANLKNGVLKISMPKINKVKQKKLKIKFE
ncbi:MAG: Hsp20/alpha crystallin family protein [Candidatus Wolfebacteria bacterium]|nr:Hsp20/alpha crystallin family protein [Candidatus Wolfebacteria bacterium]